MMSYCLFAAFDEAKRSLNEGSLQAQGPYPLFAVYSISWP